MLGLIVEKVAGTDYISYVRSAVFDGIDGVGNTTTEIEVASTFEGDKNPREPWYDDQRQQYSAFDPFVLVEEPYGVYSLETRPSNGGVVSEGWDCSSCCNLMVATVASQ